MLGEVAGDNRVLATREWGSQLDARRIGIIKPSALGDVVQTLPLLPILRQRFPAARISWVIQRELRDLVEGHPDVDDVLPIDRRPTWSQVPSFLSEVRRRRWDVVFDLQGLLRSAIITMASGARWRVGLETAREGAAWATNVTIPQTSRVVPAYARYWRLAELFGATHEQRQAWITVSTADLRFAEETLSTMPRPWIGLQWGAQWETKRWPIAKFGEVLRRALQTFGGSVIVVGGRGERSTCATLTQSLAAECGGSRVRNLAGETTLKQLAAVLQRLDVMVSNDSGPLHLAAELGRPGLGVFTCTSAVRSGPPGAQHVFVSSRLPCAASYCKVCPHTGSAHLACHDEVTVDNVYHGLQTLLMRTRPQGSLPILTHPTAEPLRIAG
jgi:heptosyltransferase I